MVNIAAEKVCRVPLALAALLDPKRQVLWFPLLAEEVGAETGEACCVRWRSVRDRDGVCVCTFCPMALTLVGTHKCPSPSQENSAPDLLGDIVSL